MKNFNGEKVGVIIVCALIMIPIGILYVKLVSVLFVLAFLS